MSRLTQYSPLSLDTFPDVFQALLRPIRSRTDEDFPRMDIDVTETGDKYVLKAELPGVEKRHLGRNRRRHGHDSRQQGAE